MAEMEIEVPDDVTVQADVTQILIDKLVATAGEHVKEYLALGRVVAKMKMELDAGNFGMSGKLRITGMSKDMTDRIIRLMVDKIYELSRDY